MKKLHKFFALAAAAALMASCADCPTCPDGGDGGDDYEPEPAPTGLIQTTPYLVAPTQTSMAVMAVTRDDSRGSVEFDTDQEAVTTGKARRRMYAYDDGIVTANSKVHKVLLDNLQPGTTYYYRFAAEKVIKYSTTEKLFSGPAYSRVYSFTTPNDTNTDFTILMLNDLHRNQSAAAREKTQSIIKGLDYDLVVFNGDCLDDVETIDDLVVWLNHYNTYAGTSNIPGIYQRGNHETRGAMSFLLKHYVDYIVDGVSYGAINWGDSRLLFLDQGEDKWDSHGDYKDMAYYEPYRKEQIPFVEEEVASNAFKNAARRIMFCHIPLHSTVMKTSGHYNPGLTYWGAALNDANIDISLSGHLHKWEYVGTGESAWTPKNTYPEFIGGGPEAAKFTITLLEKRGTALTLRALDSDGNEVLKKSL